MKIDIITIFPEYLEPLKLSLIGQAQKRGLLEVSVHDLRDYTHDAHRTVDDTPYGGGAGMVMKPEPWGEALDDVLADGVPGDGGGASADAIDNPLIIFTTPAGKVFSQATAIDLSCENHLVFCPGRYEGIDQRVVEYTRSHWRVLELSLGDYVLNGGEVAALAMVEAVTRLIPGVIGNPESLSEESHNDGLLEYPSYTKPAQWRGLAVPEILLSGNHGAIHKWQQQQSVERTQRNRPDLLGG